LDDLDLTCVFGDSPAMTTHFWSSNTLICILPPSSTPGPVVVGIKGTPLSVEHGLQLFTYKDDSDRSLLELALQVVGLKMTGRLEDAKNVAMRSRFIALSHFSHDLYSSLWFALSQLLEAGNRVRHRVVATSVQ
jgi:hypothetical protein